MKRKKARSGSKFSLEMIFISRKKKRGEKTAFVFPRLTILPMFIKNRPRGPNSEVDKIEKWGLGGRFWEYGSVSPKKKVCLRKWLFFNKNHVALRTLQFKVKKKMVLNFSQSENNKKWVKQTKKIHFRAYCNIKVLNYVRLYECDLCWLKQILFLHEFLGQFACLG